MAIDARAAFDRYEAVRGALPDAIFPVQSETVSRLGSIIGQFDTFLLDAFGVLNIGETAIPGAVAFIAAIRRSGARVRVVSNSASVPTMVSLAKLHRLGFDFTPQEIITSRDALKAALALEPPRNWGVMAARNSQIDELGIDAHILGDAAEDYDAADGFILLGSGDWTAARQGHLTASLIRTPRPVFVGNPDLVAPRENGLSLEPGWFAHDLADRIDGCRPVFYGKPFRSIFDLALTGLGSVQPARILMVGDTLHTDVLGGAAAGLRTCLLCDYGLLAGEESDILVERSGVRPDIVAARL